MKRLVLLVASFIIALVATAPTAAANPYGLWQNSIDAFAQEHGLAAANWVILPAGTDAYSACGMVPAEHALFYCSADNLAYIGIGAAEHYGATTHHLAPAIIMAHEWGHSLQFGANTSLTGSRATENGADCVAGAWLAWANANGTVTVGLGDLPGLYSLVDAIKGDGHGNHGPLLERGAALIEGYTLGLDFCGTRYMAVR